MDLHIPLPPPVQKRTLFLNMSSRKIAVERGGGAAITGSVRDMGEVQTCGVLLCRALLTFYLASTPVEATVNPTGREEGEE